MKLCTVKVVNNLHNQPHFAVVAVGDPNWPIALMGPASGPNMEHNRREAEFFAAAPSMFDMLKTMVETAKPDEPLEVGSVVFVDLIERASRLIEKHKGF